MKHVVQGSTTIFLARGKNATMGTRGQELSTMGTDAPGSAKRRKVGHVLLRACALRFVGMELMTTINTSVMTATTSMVMDVMVLVSLRGATIVTMVIQNSGTIGAMKFVETV